MSEKKQKRLRTASVGLCAIWLCGNFGVKRPIFIKMHGHPKELAPDSHDSYLIHWLQDIEETEIRDFLGKAKDGRKFYRYLRHATADCPPRKVVAVHKPERS